jgi:benzoyl-CoA reductase/2-hydroxyglutaryl-CoA dehydratase subunit BcrC/BadD/HgdB
MAGIAEAYNSIYGLLNMEYVLDRIHNLASDFKIDGAIFHSNRSCKGMDFKQFEMARMLEDKLGVLSTVFDGDQTDPNIFSEAQYETRVQALVEMMADRKARR